jgi:hypothetical protein
MTDDLQPTCTLDLGPSPSPAPARWRDDRGLTSVATVLMLVVALAGAGVVYDGGRALAARRDAINVAEGAARAGVSTITAQGLRQDPAIAAARDFLDAAGVPDADIVSITVTANSVNVVVRASRPAMFGTLIGDDEIVVYGSGEATATFGSSP